MSFPPKKIEITSCGSILELEQTLPKNKTQPEEIFVYKYIKSPVMKGQKVQWKGDYISKQLTNYFREIS